MPTEDLLNLLASPIRDHHLDLACLPVQVDLFLIKPIRS